VELQKVRYFLQFPRPFHSVFKNWETLERRSQRGQRVTSSLVVHRIYDATQPRPSSVVSASEVGYSSSLVCGVSLTIN